MLIRNPRGWEIPEREATPEALVLGRRTALKAAASIVAAGSFAWPGAAAAADLPVVMRNPRYRPERDITAEREATTYNNYYEFGSHKTISQAAQRLPLRPWTLRVDGMVDHPRDFALEDLLRQVQLEERVYRLRCVEAWSMVVPWTGFMLSELL